MGGLGSGRYGWHSSNTPKRSAEAVKQIDIRAWTRDSLLHPGFVIQTSWKLAGQRTGSMCTHVGDGRVWLVYSHRFNGGSWKEVQEEVRIAYTACGYGGQRPWFLCPKCERRAAILYLGRSLFLCRECCGLTYTSRQESGNIPKQMARKMERIKHKLSIQEPGGLLTDMRIDKPKGMHWRTYTRLMKELEEVRTTGLKSMAACLNLLHDRLQKAPKR